MKSWSLTFADDDQALRGSLSLTVPPSGAASFVARVVLPGGAVVVVDADELVPPTGDDLLVVRAEGLWAELLCETPGEHWSIGLEAFAVRFDSEEEAAVSDRGERIPLGFDLEWETPDRVVGEILVGRARHDVTATGAFTVTPG